LSSNVNLGYCAVMAELPELLPLAVVVGWNCRRIRTAADVSKNELAKYARSVGLRWTTSKVGDFETGRSAPTFSTVLAVPLALSRATGRNVTLADLVATPDGVAVVVTDKLVRIGAKVAAVTRGKPWPASDDEDMFASLLTDIDARLSIADIRRRSGLDEERLAKRLGIDADLLAAESLRLWRRAFSDERDRRAGPDANAQKRGRVSRLLQAELEEALTDGND
jgi:DNA-binding transcriptional regulator YiaG